MLRRPLKYGPMRWELKQQFKGYEVEQHNIIIDVLGGWSNELEEVTQKLLGARGQICAEEYAEISHLQ